MLDLEVDSLAPARALLGQRIPITVQLAGQLDPPVRVKATLRTAGGDTQVASSLSGKAGLAKAIK